MKHSTLLVEGELVLVAKVFICRCYGRIGGGIDNDLQETWVPSVFIICKVKIKRKLQSRTQSLRYPNYISIGYTSTEQVFVELSDCVL